MKIFLDTANVDEIKAASQWMKIDGITTNPSLVAKEKIKHEVALKAICKANKGPVSAEVIATEADEMIKEGLKLAKIAPNICVKLPLTVDGLQACMALVKKKVKVNMTLVFSASQALLAARAGATFVSPFIGRLDDISEDGLQLLADIVELYRTQNISTEILAASIRSPRQVVEAGRIGADVVTIPHSVLEKMLHHPLTDIGLAQFLADHKKAAKKIA